MWFFAVVVNRIAQSCIPYPNSNARARSEKIHSERHHCYSTHCIDWIMVDWMCSTNCDKILPKLAAFREDARMFRARMFLVENWEYLPSEFELFFCNWLNVFVWQTNNFFYRLPIFRIFLIIHNNILSVTHHFFFIIPIFLSPYLSPTLNSISFVLLQTRYRSLCWTSNNSTYTRFLNLDDAFINRSFGLDQ